MRLDHLSKDYTTNGDLAGWWLIVSDDGQVEISNPFPTKQTAQIHLNLLPACDDVLDNWEKRDLAAAVRKLDAALASANARRRQ
jgi:hypothetical protein